VQYPHWVHIYHHGVNFTLQHFFALLNFNFNLYMAFGVNEICQDMAS
jgi:hypothetical protein